MENDYYIPTDHSIQQETHRPQQREGSSLSQKTGCLLLDKMNAHLSFIETQFMRNINWQRQILKEMKKSMEKENKIEKSCLVNYSLALNLDQQTILKSFLEKHMNKNKNNLSIKEMIKEIDKNDHVRYPESPIYDFSSDRNKS